MTSESRLIVKPELDLPTSGNVDQDLAKVNSAFNKLYRERRVQFVNLLRQIPSVLDFVQSATDKDSYCAVIAPEVLKKVKSGEASWDKTAEGFIGATIRDNKTGQIIAQVKLEEISPHLLTSLNQVAFQHTLAEILQRLEVIDQKISSVLQGQKNDRLAMVESGMNLYRQAIAAKKPETRHQLLINAVDKLDEGRQKLILDLEGEIEFADKFPRTFWKMMLHATFKNVPEEVERQANLIQQSFQAVIRASYVLASAYEALGETDSLQVSLQPLREVVLKLGDKGQQIARLLPYDSAAPPEELWHTNLLQLADDITQKEDQLKVIDSQIVEVPFEIYEITGSEKDDNTNM